MTREGASKGPDLKENASKGLDLGPVVGLELGPRREGVPDHGLSKNCGCGVRVSPTTPMPYFERSLRSPLILQLQGCIGLPYTWRISRGHAEGNSQ